LLLAINADYLDINADYELPKVIDSLHSTSNSQLHLLQNCT